MGLREVVLAGALALQGCCFNFGNNVATYFKERIPVEYYFPPSFILDRNPVHEELMEAMDDFRYKVHFIPRCTAFEGNEAESDMCRSYRVGRTGVSVNGDTNWEVLEHKGYHELPVVLVDGKRYQSPRGFCQAIGEPKDCLEPYRD